MSASAIVMMIVGVGILWGGLVASMLYAHKVGKQKKQQQ
ncbi:methionine/alanine import family NSS transporter small subunit [Shouchella shacheensis]|nr:methionine/alanine import family NSS transporter small subunit [Shouchella shacheensis]